MKRKILLLLMVSFISFITYSQKSLKSKELQKVLDEAYLKFKDNEGGKNASYIKELAKVDSSIFGIAIVTVDGRVFKVGNYDSLVSIQSVSKVFTLAKIIEELGATEVEEKIGVDATGEVFNSITAIERHQGKEINPFVNPGAIATTSLVPAKDSAERWNTILDFYSLFANRELEVNMPVYISEANDNLRNQAIAHLLLAYGRMYADPVVTTDIYTRQCAVNVNAEDLAIMVSTIANGGVNPISGKKIISKETAMYTMSVMATAGLYDDAGIWLYHTGLPAKSGVGGGLIAVVPGKFGIAVVSPPLDAAGNSVRAQLAIQYIIDELSLNPYLVEPIK